jgi:hypothetical protein
MCETKQTRKNQSMGTIISVIFLMIAGVSSLMGQTSVSIYATYCNGYGVDNGWYDVDKAEGYLGSYEYTLYDFAWKSVDVNPYHLLKAYDFDRWVQTAPITAVRAYVEVELEDPSYVCPDLLVQLRARDSVEVISAKTVNVPKDTVTLIEMLLPEPTGGWTQTKVDELQLWVGAKEWGPMAYLNVYYFSLKIDY